MTDRGEQFFLIVVFDQLDEFTPNERMSFMRMMNSHWCKSCGLEQPADVRGCQCENDE